MTVDTVASVEKQETRGRKTIDDQPRDRHTVNITADNWKLLRTLGKGSASEGINKLCKANLALNK